MTINFDTEIVATGHDPISRTHSYTVRRNGRRWTVNIHDDEFARHGGNKAARRAHLGNLLTQAMTGKADGE